MEERAKTLTELARYRAGNEPDKTAFIFLGDGETESERLTHGLLDQKARAIAAQLQEWNLAGQRAMLLYPPGLEYLAAFLGCFYAGVVAVPSYPPQLRRHHSWQKLEGIVADASPMAVLTTEAILRGAEELFSTSAVMKPLKYLATERLSTELATHWREHHSRPSDLAFLQYSSGSTGRPKGVMLTHGNLLNNQRIIQSFSQAGAEGTYVSWLPLYHDMGLGVTLQSITLGCLAVLMPPMAFIQKPQRWLWAISRYRAHVSSGPNFSYDVCVRDMKPEQYEGLDLSSWRTASNGAEAINPRTLRDFARTFAPYGFDERALLQCYGLAEATVAVAASIKPLLPVVKTVDMKLLGSHRVQEVGEDHENAIGLVGCGTPRLNHELIIVNPETRRRCQGGEVGEIWVRGESVGVGYWNNPEATKEIFQAYIEGTTEGPYLRTGDLGFIADGSLFVTGRIKELIIIRGRNHYPEDIERTVQACHPALRSHGGAAFSTVIDGEERLVVVQEPERNIQVELDPEEVVKLIRAAVATQHELELHALVLIAPGSLPKTSSGKIQRRACQQLFQTNSLKELARWVTVRAEAVAPAPPPPAEAPASVLKAPASALARQLAALVSARLGIAPESYDVDRPFNHYGLDSRALVELSGVMAQALGYSLPPTLLYEHPSVSALARHLADASGLRTREENVPTSHQDDPIAIIGMACRFPGGAQSPKAFWEALRQGHDAISEVPPERWSVEALYEPTVRPGKTSTRWGGFLEAVDHFDADFFDISPREAASMDPQQRLLLEVGWEALEHAGKAPDALAGSQTGVFVGISSQDYSRLQFGMRSGTEAFAGTGNALSIVANRLSYVLDLRGPSMAVDTACSSSLVALHSACQSLRQGECDLALAGGVNLLLSPDATIVFSQAGMMSADGRCKTFDASADGYVRSEGCGVIVLKRLSEAQRDGDRILAVVRGSAVNQDGRSNGLTAPNGSAQEAVIRRALAVARVKPTELDYVEAHGTGTALGDPIEVRALARVFNEGRTPSETPLLVGSVKSNVGHLEAAAGVTGVIKVVLALQNQQIPASLHFKEPNPHIPWEQLALKVPTTCVPWSSPPGKSRLAGVSSFGFGGTNAHVILEEAPMLEQQQRGTERPLHLLALSAKTSAALRDLGLRYSAQLAETAAAELPDLCFSANTGRAQLSRRLAVTGRDAAEMRRNLEGALQEVGAAGHLEDGKVLRPQEVALLFTGQGALYAGAGQELYETQPLFRSLLDRCDELLRPHVQRPLVSILWGSDSALLNETRYAQPALFALQYALSRLWLSWGITPTAVMGHSIGEYAAACVAGVFSLEDGVKLTAARGRLMDEHTERGQMAVLFAPLEQVRALVAPFPDQVSIAAENGPANVVISGASAEVQQILKEAAARGIRTHALKVSHAFHSPLMQPMLTPFLDVARSIQFREPTIPLVSSVTGRRIGKEACEPAYWVEHVRAVVRFSEAVKTLREQDIGFFLEIGPGATLLAMASDSAGGAVKGLPSLDRDRGDWSRMLNSLSQLFEGGVRIDWPGFDRDYPRRVIDLPTYPFQRRRHWFDLQQGRQGAPEVPALKPLPDPLPSIEEHLVEQQWHPKGLSEGYLPVHPGRWLVLAGRDPLGKALTDQLEARGAHCIRVEAGPAYQRGGEGTWYVNPDNSAEFHRLLQEVTAPGAPPLSGVLYLWSLEAGTAVELSLPSLEQAQRLTCQGLLFLLQALSSKDWSGTRPRLWGVTRAAVPTGYDADPPSLAQACVGGLGKVAALEHPEVWGGLLDLPSEAAPDEATLLLRELAEPPGEQQVAFRGGIRYVARLMPARERPSKQLAIRADGTYLVTGGLGALGLQTAQWLVSEGARHLVLLGRAGPKAGSTPALVAALERSGAQVLVLQADVSDAQRIAGVLEHIRGTLPPLRGIIHAAGVSGGHRLLKDMKAENLEEVLRAKVFGSWVLHQATRGLELDFFVTTSSIASVWGSIGQGHYAAANHFLDVLAHYRRHQGRPALSVNWGPWDGAGMGSAPELTAWLSPLGIKPLSFQQGLAALKLLLERDFTQATAARVDWRAFKDVYEARGRRPLLEHLGRDKKETRERGPAGLDLSKQTPATLELLIQHLQLEVGKIFGFGPAQLPEPHRGFTTLGMNSLMAVELKNKVEPLVGRSLPATLAFDYPTIESLANHLLSLVAEPVPAPQAPERRQDGPEALAQALSEPIAIIGIGCRFPGGADGPGAYWELLSRGGDAINDKPTERWDIHSYLNPDPEAPGKTYTLSAGLTSQVEMFDAQFFGISPREAEAMDPQQRMALELSWHAIENAGYSPTDLAGSQTGVFFGVGANEYARLCEASPSAIDPAYVATGNALNAIAGRVAYSLGLEGPAMAIDTACSSSMVAIHLACQSLLRRECGAALAGGVNLLLTPDTFVPLAKARMLAPDGRCKTFDAEANGYVRAEGGGVLVLKRLSEAVAAGDSIIAVIRGSAVNQDGRSSGLTVPRGPAQQAVITSALATARIRPEQVQLVEAHGTGTALGDPIEMHALDAVYGAGRGTERPLVVGSVKTNIGHTEAASGVASVIKVALALQHGEIPPHLHFKQLNPHIQVDQRRIRIPTQPIPWPVGLERRIAAASAFGFSGTNAHIILEEAPAVEAAQHPTRRPVHLLPLSGKTEEALEAAARGFLQYLSAARSPDVESICHTAQLGRTHFKHRLSVVGADREGMLKQLEQALERQLLPGVARGAVPAQPEKLVFLFSGQGSQYVGMARELYATQPLFTRTLNHCDELLRPLLGHSLLSLLWGDDAALLDETQFTQPALFALEYALAQLWCSWGLRPDLVMGHSIGEFAAACLAEVFSLEDGLKLVAARGRLMAALPDKGGMVAVMADEEQVATAVAPYGNEVSVAAFNGPAQLVLSGSQRALQEVRGNLERAGIETRPLQVSHAFHSPLMEPMLGEFARIAGEVRYSAPRMRVISNVTGLIAGEELATAGYWVRHVREAVRFQQGIETAYAQGGRVFLEVGPQSTLLRLGQRCVPSGEALWLPSLGKGQDAWQQLLATLGHLHVRGLEVDWRAFQEGHASRRLAIPTYPFQRKRYWVGGGGSKHAHSGRSAVSPGASPPYPGRRLRLPMSKEVRFETELSAATPAFLDDHRIHGTVVVPGAAHVSMLLSALSAGQDASGGRGCALQDVTFMQALVLPDTERPRVVQLGLERAAPDASTFQIGSFLGEGDEPEWVVHASGRASGVALREASLAGTAIDIPGLRAASLRHHTGEDFYSDFWKMGYTLGPSFRWIDQAWVLDGEVLCELRHPVSAEEASQYQLHPGLIDSCFQLIGFVSGSPSGSPAADELFVPFHIDSFNFYQRPAPGERLWCHVKRQASGSQGGSSLTADIRILDSKGHLLAAVAGFQVRRTRRDVFLRLGDTSYRDWMYSVEWQPQDRSESLPADYMPPAQVLTQGLTRFASELGAELDVTAYGELLRHLEELSLSYVHHAFQQLWGSFQESWKLPAEALMRHMGVVNRHQRLFLRLLEMLEEGGFLRREASQWEFLGKARPESPESQRAALLTRYPAQRAELALLEQCARQLPAVLRGEVEPLQVLFPGGDPSALSALYSSSVGARALNLMTQKALALALAQLPAGRRVRILEVGAGTGGTTSYLLSILNPEQTDYVFTDVSPLFTERARGNFGSHRFVQYEVLDIEKSPEAQGFEAHQYDIVVAANVLHATQDLRQAVQHVRRLLVPGGLLLVIEGTERQRWLDLIFGLTDGWWRFTDQALRASYPLLASPQWRTLLSECGFEGTDVVVPKQDSPQAVIVARASAARVSPIAADAGRWLVFTDEGGTGQKLSGLLRERGAQCTLVRVGERYEQHADGSFTIRPTQGEDYHALVAAMRTAPESWRGVVHLWSVDSPRASDSLTLEELAAASPAGCQSVLLLVQGLLKTQAAQLPSLWLVTQGAQAVEPGAGVPGLAHAALWGMGRVIALEHPELNCVRVDLDPAAPDAEALCRELFSSEKEDQIVLRGKSRHVARLKPFTASDERPGTLSTENLSFHPDGTYLLTGGTGGLGLLTARWMVQKGARHLVLLGRSDAEARTRAEREELAKLGAEVVLVQGDVSNREQLAGILDQMDRTMPPLRGVIHGVGVLDDGILLHQSWDRFARVMAPKVDGAWNLHTLTAKRSLDFFVLFSSAVSMVGAPGQANHAAANAFLDALASHLRAQGRPALAINWGPWSGSGAAAGKQLGERWALKGIGTISPDQGLKVLEHLMAQSTAQVGVLPINWPVFLKQFPAHSVPPLLRELFLESQQSAPAGQDELSPLTLQQQLSQASGERHQELLVSYIRHSMARSLKLAAAEIDVHQPLNTLGIDSLLAVEFRKRLRTDLDIDVPVVSLLEGVSIDALASSLSEKRKPPAPHSGTGEAPAVLADDVIEGSL